LDHDRWEDTVMLRRRLPLTLGAAAALLASVTLAVPVLGGSKMVVSMTGSQEVPGPGDPDGSGMATVRVSYGQAEVCYTLEVSGIATAIAAHIHNAPAGVAGPVVVSLTAPSSGSSSGCVSVDRALAKAILQDPANYYVNVHNTEYPAGALRGQLSK
jgi:hypothetical protein